MTLSEDASTLRGVLRVYGASERAFGAMERIEAALQHTLQALPKSDVQIIRERLECAKPGATTDALEALKRLEAKLPTPAYETGFYLYGLSRVYYYDGNNEWYDVNDGYKPTDYPARIPRNYFVRLYRADEVERLT